MNLKRLKAPKFWRVARKETKWIVSPRPGPHKKLESVPLQVLLRDVLNILEKGKEARTVIKMGEILVDGRKRKDHAYPVGLFDVVSMPTMKKTYRAVPSKNVLDFIEISDKESGVKICRIVDKTTLKKGKVQLNLHDGKTILVDKDDYKTGDSIIVGLPDLKIQKHIPFEKGAVGVVVRGTGVGSLGKVKEIKSANAKEKARIIAEFGDKEQEILKDRFFIVGKDKPEIKIGE